METTATQNAQESAEALLARFCNAGEASALQALETLLSDHAEPVIRRITRFELGFRSGHSQQQEEEDVRSDAVLQLISRLQTLRKSPVVSIENFSAYVAGITYNCCNRLLNLKYPARCRLKNRIRYVLNHNPRFSLWQHQGREWICGLAGAHGTGSPGSPEGDVKPGKTSLSDFIESIPSRKSIAQMKLDALLSAIFDWRGGAMTLEEVVHFVAQLWNVRDEPTAVLKYQGEEIDIRDLLPDPSLDVSSKMELQCFLKRLWREICDLPQRQRAALLLNLRDAQQRDALVLFTLVEVASLREIAAAIEMPLQEFPALWNKLPLDDLSIAEFLGLSRQQVINLRKSARERLARRMARLEAASERNKHTATGP